ncbi:DUF1456 family protein [Flavobacterium sp. WV_118_3]|uniref:DUF1456 family protein n=1 Tax=Flavobacterium sp. WV_118_3 TaxID=3151764 RepID=UPI00321AF8F7
MTNNDIFKKLRVALQLRDDQIVEILELVDFRISKGEIGNFFRTADHPKYVECGDQVLRNFLNGLVIHLRGTKENPKNAMDVLAQNKEAVKTGGKLEVKAKAPQKPTTPKPAAKKPMGKKPAFKAKKQEPIVEKVRFKNGKNKNS